VRDKLLAELPLGALVVDYTDRLGGAEGGRPPRRLALAATVAAPASWNARQALRVFRVEAAAATDAREEEADAALRAKVGAVAAGAQVLNWQARGLADADCAAVARALRSAAARATCELCLGGNAIGDAGLQQLAPALAALPRLRDLEVWGNAFGDEGAMALAAALSEGAMVRGAHMCASANARLGPAGRKALQVACDERRIDLVMD